jgi:hypothetical protein
MLKMAEFLMRMMTMMKRKMKMKMKKMMMIWQANDFSFVVPSSCHQACPQMKLTLLVQLKMQTT